VDVYAVRLEVSSLLGTMTGLRAASWAQSPVAPPIALVGWPDVVDFRQTYARGTSRIPDLPALVVVGKASLRSAEKALGAFVSETGSKSVPALIEAHAGLWASCDVVTVASVTFPAVSIAGVDYLAAELHLDVTGKGA
jgi:hypothetical protein